MSIYRKIQIHLPVWGLLRRLSSRANPRHVLVLCDDAMGDLLILSGVLKHLKNKGFVTTLVVRESWKDLAQYMWADRVIGIKMDLYKESLRYRIKILNRVRHTRYEWAASSLFPSAINANLLSNCGAAKRYAYRWGRDWRSKRRLFFATHKIDAMPLKPSSHIHGDILEMLAYYYSSILGEPLTKQQIAPVLNGMEQLPWPSQVPPKEYLLYISDTMDALRQYSVSKLYPVLLAYATKNQLQVVVSARNPSAVLPKQKGLINLTGKTTLAQLYQIVAHAKIVIGNETGATHMAWILGKPTVMIYGGGHYGLFRPAANCKLVYHKKACYGCSWDMCPEWRKQIAPCIDQITTAQIKEALAQVAHGQKSAAPTFTEREFE